MESKIVLFLAIILVFSGCNPILQLEKEGIMCEGEAQTDLIELEFVQTDDVEEDENLTKPDKSLEIIPSDAEVVYFKDIFEYDGMLYVVRYGEGMYRMNLDGSGKETVNDDKEIFEALFIDGIAYYLSIREIYFVDNNQAQHTIQKTEFIDQAVLVGEYFYYLVCTNTEEQGIYRLKKDGGDPVEKIYNTAPNSIQVSNGWIYFVDYIEIFKESSRLRRCIAKINYQGENKTLVYVFDEYETILVGERVDDFAIDGDWLFCNFNGGLVVKYNMKTGENYEYKDDADQAWFYKITAEEGQLFALTCERKGEEGFFHGVGIIDMETLTIKKVLVRYNQSGPRDWMIWFYVPIKGRLYYYFNHDGEPDELYAINLDCSSKTPQLISTFQWSDME
jgi:hypothetical protein